MSPMTNRWRLLILAALTISGAIHAHLAHAQWTNGLSTNQNYFPIGVWLQRPEDAVLWRNAGVNLYTGLWDGPTTNQLNTLRAAGMQTIADQNTAGLNYNLTLTNGRPVIVGWLLQDEPDNAQPDGTGGYGPPIPTAQVQQAYQQTKTNDPTRPIFLNLSQGIGWDNGTWYGQGGAIVPSRDYPQYILGSDIISFDIYPMCSPDAAVAGHAWRVALGVDRLRQYAPTNHIVWAFIETGDIHNNGRQATIPQIRAEVWMALIHGATGINYFIHGNTSVSTFDDRALLRPENAARLAGVTAINNEVQSLAAVLKTKSIPGFATLTNVVGTTPVDFTVKQSNGSTYLFTVGMRTNTTTKLFQLQGMPDGPIQVLGENRALPLVNGSFTDTFNGYEAHLYTIPSVGIISLSISKTGTTNTILSWNSLTNTPYTIQHRTNLSQTNWLPLGTVSGTGATTTFTNTNLSPQRFFRVYRTSP